jgi:hypothetical protein
MNGYIIRIDLVFIGSWFELALIKNQTNKTKSIASEREKNKSTGTEID